jgi:hypothetical protein
MSFTGHLPVGYVLLGCTAECARPRSLSQNAVDVNIHRREDLNVSPSAVVGLRVSVCLCFEKCLLFFEL